jgi:hypothetical protein
MFKGCLFTKDYKLLTVLQKNNSMKEYHVHLLTIKNVEI